MRVDVLPILWRLPVDVARKVEFEVVPLDLLHCDHAAEPGHIGQSGEHIDDLVDVLRTQPVLRPVPHEPAAGVDHEDALALLRVLFVEHDDAGRDAGAKEQVGRQADNAFDITPADQITADFRLGIAPEQHAVRQDAGALAGVFERADDMQQIGVVALLVQRCAQAAKPLGRVVQRVETGAPPRVGKRQICNDLVERFQRLAFAEFRVGQGVALHDRGTGIVMQDHVHPGEASGRRVLFVPYSVSGVRASSASFSSREPDPQAGSYTAVCVVVRASWMPSTRAMTRLTSAGV